MIVNAHTVEADARQFWLLRVFSTLTVAGRLYWLLAVAAIVPTILGAKMTLGKVNEYLATTREREGIMLMRVFHNIGLEIREHESAVLNASLGLADDGTIGRWANRVDDLFKAGDEVLAAQAVSTSGSTKWQAAKQVWANTRFVDKTSNDAYPLIAKKYSEIGQLMQDLIVMTVQDAGLLLDSDIESMHLIMALCVDMPGLSQDIAEIRLASWNALRQRTLSVSARRSVERTIGNQNLGIRRIAANFEKAAALDLKNRNALERQIAALKNLREKAEGIVEQNILAGGKPDYSPAEFSLRFGEFRATLSQTVNELVKNLDLLMEQHADRIKKEMYVMVAAMTIFGCILFVLMFLMIHSISLPLASAVTRLTNSSDALSLTSQNLSTGAEQVSQQASVIAAAATQMNQTLQSVSGAIEEMSISVSEVANKANDSAGVAGEAKITAQNTRSIVEELGHNANEIGNVIEIIGKIAEQTNMLALNASIEAAGAGAAGKGFAVVASEVKELARQTGRSSAEIKGKIAAIQASTARAAEAIGNISDVINRVSEISGAIAIAVGEQASVSREIAGSVTEIATASGEVTRNVSGISEVTQRQALDAVKTASFSTELTGVVATFSHMVSHGQKNE